MNHDIEIRHDDELGVIYVEAETDSGVDFVDAYVPADGLVNVQDSGRIILGDRERDAVWNAARERGLKVEFG